MTTNDSKRLEDEDLVSTKAWMIRPCEAYDSEHSECTKIKSRIYQYYHNGELSNCNPWVPILHDCRRWFRKQDVAAGARIIRHEEARIAERLKTREENDVMPERNIRPPPNWNRSLPEHILAKQEGSYLSQHMEDMMQPFNLKKSSFCVIS